MSKNSEKQKRELDIFNRFSQKARLKIVRDSILNCEPPEPDICCEIEGEGKVWFELAEACSEDLAREFNRFPENGVWVGFIGNSTETTVTKKIRKSYQANGPIELLIYDDGRHLRPDKITIASIEHVLNIGTGMFRRVWYLSKNGLYQVYPNQS